MCTLIVFKEVDPHHPLVIAANRDERPTRPTANPADLAGGVHAPLDLVHGGSWIGVNRRGLAAALTNRFAAPRYHGRRSRGLVVTEALSAATTAEAARLVAAAPAGTYNGFQLVLDDGRETVLLWCDAAGIFRWRLGPGIWIFTGDDVTPGVSRRAEFVREWMGRTPRPDDPDWLRRLLTLHGPGPEDGTCVHGPGVNMESVFSMVIRRPAVDRIWDISWRSGRPCRSTDFHLSLIPIEANRKGAGK